MKYTITRTTKRFVNGVLVEDTTVVDEADTPEQLSSETRSVYDDYFARLSRWIDRMPRFK